MIKQGVGKECKVIILVKSFQSYQNKTMEKTTTPPTPGDTWRNCMITRDHAFKEAGGDNVSKIKGQ